MPGKQTKSQSKRKDEDDDDEANIFDDDENGEYGDNALKGQINEDSDEEVAEDVQINEKSEEEVDDSIFDKDGNRKKENIVVNKNTGPQAEGLTRK